jgi:hypothetical protein
MYKPIIELYEYQIIGQPNDKSTIVKFGDIDDSPTDSVTNSLSDCSRVSIEGLENSKIPDMSRSSCDPIRSIKGGTLYKKYKFYDINNLYDNYKFFLVKNTDVLEEISNESKKSLSDNLNIIIRQQIELLNNSLAKTPNLLLDTFKKQIENLDSLVKEDLIFENITKKTEETAFIQKINIRPDNKLILLGDFHGSFHTFFRLLCRFHRYGILNLETYIINEPYKIIFLGDVMDRGKYALDIINIIFKLMTLNNNDVSNQKIFYIRGNHEVYSQYNVDGGLDEIVKKLSLETQNENFTIKLLIKFNKVLALLPSALLITCNHNKYWCSHGGFPKMYITQKIPNDDIVFIDNATPETINAATEIRWSDFGYNPSSDYFPSARGPNIYTYSYTGTMKFLNNNDINFIIRGHQDSYGNSFYFRNSIYMTTNVINNPISRKINNFLYYNNTRDSHILRVNGPIARMLADKIDFSGNNINLTSASQIIEIFPILTISTNMDAGRTLISDSFALLRFDIDSTEITDFTKNTLSIVNNINKLISDKSNINKGNILLNILNVTNDICKLINDNTIPILLHLYLYYDNYIKSYPENLHIIEFKRNNFMIICNNICEIFYDMNEMYDYYRIKTLNLINKFDVYEKIAQNRKYIKKLKDLFSNKLVEINNHIDNINNHIYKHELTSIEELEKAIKLNIYIDESHNTKNQQVLLKPKLLILLDELNKKISEYSLQR